MRLASPRYFAGNAEIAMTKVGTITHSHKQRGAPRCDDALDIERDEMSAVPEDWSADTEGHRIRPRPRRREAGRRARPSSGPPTGRRLGSLEFMFLALIALGVAITVAMAVIDPSG
jgi:hypothetical protein